MIDVEKRKATLQEKLLELNSRVERVEDDLRQPGDDDWVENATESENDEVLEEIGDVTREEIRQIKRALVQIEAGTYGVCMRCRNPIPEKRLDAMPHATQCADCSQHS